MVKVFIKGGVWKNSEDEILKAAVMKYGKQQWARVASLLNRKTAKQCKARWHEWLDPSVKKVEWSREEEEKLLHLAKLMPAQWKTVGPLIGRTATQCQEHYEQLLDEAAGGSGEARKQQGLQAGQIDSHPETKPARPDPIDMDEDEMEMLQEARARLANTQGKKAKRKAREKMLAQAKRLADLQKRRELKQAGLLSGAARKKASKRRKEIDLGVEIPFHKPAPAGFHDVTEEDRTSESARKRRMKSVDFKKINENQYRSRDREAALAQKREEARLKMLEKSNMQYVVAQVSKTNDPLNIRKRGTLELPEPQVNTKELEQLAKLEQQNKSVEISGGNAATQALLGDYSDRPLPTPMRTPMANAGKTHQSLMREASQLRRLEEGQTPLLGGVAAAGFKTTGLDDEEEGEENETAAAALATATPKLPGKGGQTPMADRKANQTPMSLAPRDQLGLNTMDDATSVASTAFGSIRDMARAERRAAKRARQELEEALANLPAPQFEYELATPEIMAETVPEVETVRDEDMADVEAAEREAKRKAAKDEYEKQSSVLKRKELPRPGSGAIPTWKAKDDAETLVRQEMIRLLKHDAHAFPVIEEGKKKQKKRKKEETTKPEPLSVFSEKALEYAKEILQEEVETVIGEKIGAGMSSGKFATESAVLDEMKSQSIAASLEGASGLLFQENKGFVEDGDKIESLKIEFQAIREATMTMKKKNDKTSTKLGIKNGGYVKRTKALEEEILQQFALSQNARIEEAVFTRLQSMEVAGASRREESLQEEIDALEKGEAELQKKYGDLLLEKKRLMAGLRTK